MNTSYSNYWETSKSKGYKVFEDKPYNLNIVGWRNLAGKVDHFDDVISVYWKDSTGYQDSLHMEATTRPGLHYLRSPLVSKGTAILAAGQYLSSYKIGLHKTYKALVQAKPVEVYRDSNRNDIIDLNLPTEKGLFGINIHKASLYNKLVGMSSAGCQVIKKSSDFDFFMSLCGISAKYYGNSFSYTLVEF